MLLPILLVLLMSPLWPIGPNPMVGDPLLIVNKTTNQLAFIKDGKVQKIYQVATGKRADLTPIGMFTVTVKAINPYYRKKDIPGGKKENPLGTRWIGFDANQTDGRIYGIHGNNNPSSIGRYVTEGCVRMRNDEIEELFPQVPIGTKVAIVSKKASFTQLGREFGAIPEEIPEPLQFFLQ